MKIMNFKKYLILFLFFFTFISYAEKDETGVFVELMATGAVGIVMNGGVGGAVGYKHRLYSDENYLGYV